MSIPCAGAPVHQRIIKIVNDSPCFSPEIPELDRGKKPPVDIKDIVLSQGIVKFEFIQPIPLIEMDGCIHPLFSKIRQVL